MSDVLFFGCYSSVGHLLHMESSQDNSNWICIDKMNRFLQICRHVQCDCTGNSTEIHPCPARDQRGYGQSVDWSPDSDHTAIGRFFLSLAYHPRSVITREVVPPLKRDSDVRTPETGVETGSSTAKTLSRPRALFLLFRLFFFFFFTVDYACLVVKSGVQRTPMGKPLNPLTSA